MVYRNTFKHSFLGLGCIISTDYQSSATFHHLTFEKTFIIISQSTCLYDHMVLHKHFVCVNRIRILQHSSQNAMAVVGMSASVSNTIEEI